MNNEVVKIYKILGWISIAVSLVLFPVVFGTGGIVCGYLTRNRGDKTYGTIMMIVAVASTIMGMLFGLMAAGY